MASLLERAIQRHRNAIRSIDRAALANVYLTYQDIMDRLNPQIELLQQALRDKGELTASQLFRLDRYQELQRQIAAEMRLLAERTGAITEQAQQRAVTLALDSAETLAASSATTRAGAAIITSSWVRVPFSAVEDFIGATRSGPLFELLSTFEDVTARVLVDSITDALATGKGPRAVADAITKSTEIARNRALLISRTEMMRSLRSSTLVSYENNRDILNGWRWISALSDRTCCACLAMHGTEHPLDEPMESHPACRCAASPILRDIPTRTLPSGEQWLKEQPIETQQKVLGISGAQAFRTGEVQLSDFVRVSESKDWGKSVSDGGVAWARMQAEQGRRWAA